MVEPAVFQVEARDMKESDVMLFEIGPMTVCTPTKIPCTTMREVVEVDDDPGHGGEETEHEELTPRGEKKWPTSVRLLRGGGMRSLTFFLIVFLDAQGGFSVKARPGAKKMSPLDGQLEYLTGDPPSVLFVSRTVFKRR